MDQLRVWQAIVDMLVDLVLGDIRYLRFMTVMVQLDRLNSLDFKMAVDNIQTLLSMKLPQRSGQTLLHVCAARGR